MAEQDYYPAGAYNDPDAPWNEKEVPVTTASVEFLCNMRKVADVKTTDYTPETVTDEEGFTDSVPDFSNTDWLQAWNEYNYTPQELIYTLHEITAELAEGRMPKGRPSYWRMINRECKNWEEYDQEAGPAK